MQHCENPQKQCGIMTTPLILIEKYAKPNVSFIIIEFFLLSSPLYLLLANREYLLEIFFCTHLLDLWELIYVFVKNFSF